MFESLKCEITITMCFSVGLYVSVTEHGVFLTFDQSTVSPVLWDKCRIFCLSAEHKQATKLHGVHFRCLEYCRLSRCFRVLWDYLVGRSVFYNKTVYLSVGKFHGVNAKLQVDN